MQAFRITMRFNSNRCS